MSINKNLNSGITNQPKKVLIIARISTVNQDLRSLVAQVAYCQDWVEKNLEGSFEFIPLTFQGSGENLTRPELAGFEH